jgi:hypothetical protein
MRSLHWFRASVVLVIIFLRISSNVDVNAASFDPVFAPERSTVAVRYLERHSCEGRRFVVLQHRLVLFLCHLRRQLFEEVQQPRLAHADAHWRDAVLVQHLSEELQVEEKSANAPHQSTCLCVNVDQQLSH